MLIRAAEENGTFIPHFCYHKKLSVAANCRMCLVDIEKAPKPMPACATPVTQGMIVRTKSEKAVKAQQSVMEFLLINHPLDCPICDQGGECQLQDLAVGYGGSKSRYNEEKRVVFPKDVGPLISMEEMSRCMVKSLLRLSYFYMHESCGQCTPCREGTGWLWRVVQRIEAGQGRPEDIDLLNSVADNIQGRTICALGDAAAMPVRAFIKHFREEFVHHIEHKTCVVPAYV